MVYGNNMGKELMQQAFMGLAEELEKKCGDWQELPETEMDVKLRERITAEVKKREEKAIKK